MQPASRLIAELIDRHRRQAHTATSVAAKIQHIDAMARLRRIRDRIGTFEQCDLAALESSLAP